MRGLPQALAQTAFNLVKQQINALLQTGVFKHQRVPHHHTRHTWVFFSKLQQHGHNARRSQGGVFFALVDLVNQAKNSLLDELKQRIKHLRFTGKVAVQSGFAHLKPRRQLGIIGMRGDHQQGPGQIIRVPAYQQFDLISKAAVLAAQLQAALDKAWRADCYKVLLATGSKRESTLRFYEGVGFTRDAKTYFEIRRP